MKITSKETLENLKSFSPEGFEWNTNENILKMKDGDIEVDVAPIKGKKINVSVCVGGDYKMNRVREMPDSYTQLFSSVHEIYWKAYKKQKDFIKI